MSDVLPRVTYSNIDADLTPVQRRLDRDIPELSRSLLGRDHGAIIATSTNVVSESWEVAKSPLDQDVVIGRFATSTPDMIEAAVGAAVSAQPQWAAVPWIERAAIVRRLHEILAEDKFRIAVAALFEVGKSRLEAIGEAEEAVDMPLYYAKEMERNAGFRAPMAQVRDGESTESLLLPVGVFAVISPFNFPVALSLNMIIGAILGGNSVVFKPAPGCGLTGRLLVEAILNAGIPPGVVNLLYGDGDVGASLCGHPAIGGVAFTGSHEVGMELARKALSGAHAKPVIAEMGGKNPAYVTRNANLREAAEGVARSAFGLQGQKCSACSVVYVDKAVKEEFVEHLLAFTQTLKVGDPRLEGVFVGAVQTAATVSRFERSVVRAKQDGRVLAGGNRVDKGGLERGFFVEPTIVEFDQPHDLTRDELFMPFLAIRAVDSLEAALTEGNDVTYGLAAGVYTQDADELDYFLNTVEAGVVYANRASGATTGAWPGVQSFCGWKGSGLTGKGGLGTYWLPQFMREQSRTLII